MCTAPEPPPPPAERQAMKSPTDTAAGSIPNSMRARRGFWASVMTSPQGVMGAPTVTGTPGV